MSDEDLDRIDELEDEVDYYVQRAEHLEAQLEATERVTDRYQEERDSARVKVKELEKKHLCSDEEIARWRKVEQKMINIRQLCFEVQEGKHNGATGLDVANTVLAMITFQEKP